MWTSYHLDDDLIEVRERSEHKYLFNPEKYDDTEVYYNDPTWFYRKWGILVSVCFSFWVSYSQSKAQEMEYFIAKAMAAQAEEEESAEPVEEEEEAAPEENPDNFF